MLEAVIFDMDGVIFDSERLLTWCWMELDKKYGIPGVDQVCYDCLGTNDAETKLIFLDTYGQDFPFDTYEKEVWEMYLKQAAEGKLEKKPGVEELLSWLREKGIKIGLATSSRRKLVMQEIEEAGLLPYFDSITCGDEITRSKPEPEIYLKACENLKVNPDNAFAIEDSYNGVRSGKRAGMSVIMVPDIKQPDEEMRGLADKILQSLHEVKEYFTQYIADENEKIPASMCEVR